MRMMPETEASGHVLSCTVVIGEAVLFFGGQHQTNQISQLTPLGLIRIGTLPFSFDHGTCLVIDSQLFLGFPGNMEGQYHSCWSRLAVLKSSESYENFILAPI